jgi:CheY-like chemotaxis protein
MSIDILKARASDRRTLHTLETIEVSAQRGAGIVRQVLSFARGLEGERVEIQPKHLLRDVENILRETFPKDIRAQFFIPDDIWTIQGDATQVHQILLNLCVNARDAMPEGGTLTVRAENRELDAQYQAMHPQARAGRYVKISVTDTGIGIPTSIRDKIFEPFFTTKALDQGTGQGLSTVLAIVKSHEGFINVASEPGRGASFEVFLPALDFSGGDPDEARREETLPRGQGETVLVVDDEASILTITAQTLEAYGYHVLTSTNGAEALAIYAQQPNQIHVVLTDMMMPILDGPAMILALLRINPQARVIAASGLEANTNTAKVTAAGVTHFLNKPYTAGTLLKKIREILDLAAPGPAAA